MKFRQQRSWNLSLGPTVSSTRLQNVRYKQGFLSGSKRLFKWGFLIYILQQEFIYKAKKHFRHPTISNTQCTCIKASSASKELTLLLLCSKCQRNASLWSKFHIAVVTSSNTYEVGHWDNFSSQCCIFSNATSSGMWLLSAHATPIIWSPNHTHWF